VKDTTNMRDDLKPAAGIYNGLLFVAPFWAAALTIFLWVWLT